MKQEPFIFGGALKGVLTLLTGEPWNIPRSVLLKASGLVEEDLVDSDANVPLQSFALTLEKAAEVTNNPNLIFELAELFEKYATTLTHYAIRKSPTVRAAINVGTRNARLVIYFRSIELEENEDFSYWRWEYLETLGGLQQFPAWIPARAVVILRSALGRDWFPEEVSFEQKTPDDLTPFTKMFGKNLLFNQRYNYVKLKTKDLDHEMPTSEKDVWKYLVDLSEKFIAEQVEEPQIINSVKKHIIDALPQDQANIKSIAKKLGRSPRTLQRELNSTGTSFSSILEETRRELANKYLLDTDLHISQITFLLGFSEVSVFSRAVNRWFGQPPSLYRQQNQSNKRPA